MGPWIEGASSGGAALMGALATAVLTRRRERHDAARSELAQMRSELVDVRVQAARALQAIDGLSARLADLSERINEEDK